MRGASILGVGAALAGLYGALHNHLPSLRFFALQQLFEVAVSALSLVSFGVFAMSRLSGRLGSSICSFMGRKGQDEVHEWTLSMLDGWDNCEERWQLVGLAFLITSSLFLVSLSYIKLLKLLTRFSQCVRAHLVAQLFAYWRFLVRRQSVLGKPLPLLSTDVETPSYSAKRLRSHTYSHNPRPSTDRLLLFPSPYSPPSSQPSSPVLPPSPRSSIDRISKPRSRTIDGCQRRAGHAPQPSDSHVVVYAPLLMTLDEVQALQVPIYSESIASPSSDSSTSSFSLFKEELAEESDKQC
jgi:hypothetical protein